MNKMYPPKRIDGFGVWFDTYGDRIYVNQVDVQKLDRMYEEAEKRLGADGSDDDWYKFWVSHGKVYDKLSEKAVQKYWKTVVMNG